MLHAGDREAFYRNYLYDISPTTDERPYFFHFFKWNRLLKTYESLERKWQPLIEGGYLVPLALVQAAILSVALILLPIHKHGRSIEGRLPSLAYFFCLGLGYMFIEMAMVQRFILLLGLPSYSISFVIFSLLFASGIGSYNSGRIDPGSTYHKLILLAIALLATLYALASPLINQLLGLPITFRLLATILIVTPLGILMGMPFPLGIGTLENSKKELIPWAWATNGCASVLGSIIPIIVALSLGFSTVFLAAGAIYLTSLLVIHIKSVSPQSRSKSF
jgi:hypothetical protein